MKEAEEWIRTWLESKETIEFSRGTHANNIPVSDALVHALSVRVVRDWGRDEAQLGLDECAGKVSIGFGPGTDAKVEVELFAVAGNPIAANSKDASRSQAI